MKPSSLLVLLASAAACSPTVPRPADATSSRTAEQPGFDCAAEAFVACPEPGDCTRRGGAFLEPQACFERAADACAAADCEHGCNLYATEVGGPKLAVCATNAASAGHMKRCGGLAQWQCPEDMVCATPDDAGFDAQGLCVHRSGFLTPDDSSG